VTCSGCAALQVCLANGSCCQPATCASVAGGMSDGCGGIVNCYVE
jgi:hypothetical protein